MKRQLIAQWLAMQGRLGDGALLLPEQRELEMYTSKRRTGTSETMVDADARIRHELLPHVMPSWLTLQLVEASFTLGDGTHLEGMTSWQRYLALPRKSVAQKVIAESYRLLRIVRVSLQHPAGELKGTEQRIELGCNTNAYPLQLVISAVGLRLLDSLCHYYLRAQLQHDVGPAYLDAMVLAYFTDLVAELRGFEDEDRALCQFRPSVVLNRHWRLACRNPRYRVDEGYCLLQLGPRYADGQTHPIDFFIRLNECHYRVPMEALVVPPGSGSRAFDGQPVRCAIAMRDLAGWQIDLATVAGAQSNPIVSITR